MSEEPYQNGTLRYRLERLEEEQKAQRDRLHRLDSELSALRLLIQSNTDKIGGLSEDVKALKRGFYTFAFSTVGAAVVFAFTVFALLGKH